MLAPSLSEAQMAIKAHVGFSLPGNRDFGGSIAKHFSSLGYRLVEQAPNEWVFRRGNKLAALWRFNIRAYHTTLRVRAAPEPNGDTRVSCDWEVWTFMNLTTGADVSTLEAEGRQLESVLRERA
jgi:hypothetical protein